MKKARFILILTLLFSLFLCSCKSDQQSVHTDPLYLKAILEDKGYTVVCYQQSDPLLSALAAEMQTNLKREMKGALISYLYVSNADSGVLEMELFIFEKKSDAQSLYDYSLKNSPFVPGESECRIDETVVYMGYVTALQAVEGSAK